MIDKDSLVTNGQETNESLPDATLAQTSDVHVQAILMKLAVFCLLLSISTLTVMCEADMSDEVGEDEEEGEEELDPPPP